jgi:hypothetical protein
MAGRNPMRASCEFRWHATATAHNSVNILPLSSVPGAANGAAIHRIAYASSHVGHRVGSARTREPNSEPGRDRQGADWTGIVAVGSDDCRGRPACRRGDRARYARTAARRPVPALDLLRGHGDSRIPPGPCSSGAPRGARLRRRRTLVPPPSCSFGRRRVRRSRTVDLRIAVRNADRARDARRARTPARRWRPCSGSRPALRSQATRQ